MTFRTVFSHARIETGTHRYQAARLAHDEQEGLVAVTDYRAGTVLEQVEGRVVEWLDGQGRSVGKQRVVEDTEGQLVWRVWKTCSCKGQKTTTVEEL